MKHDGKIALVTGGSRGIGRAIAIKLAEGGAYLYINYVRNEEAAAETLRIIREGNGAGELSCFDVSKFEATQETINCIVKEKGRVDILVNNAAISTDGFIVRMRERDWSNVINTNLTGTFNCCKAVVRHMMKQRWGRIVNITSVVAEAGNAGQVNYSASKAGILGLTKSLARELGSRNICVNAVSPGFIETDMTSSVSDEERETVRNQIPLSRFGTPEDVAGVVAFLVSEKADYITGQVIRVNGGLYM